MIPTQAATILWAQWRSMRNFRGGVRTGPQVSTLVNIIWYGMWSLGAFAVHLLCSEAADVNLLERLLRPGAFLVMLYWQLIPVLMVSTGMTLDLKRLIVYPIAHGQLFSIEVLLRFTSGIEMLLMLSGAFTGLLRNPAVPWWAPFGLLVFIAFNLLLSVGLRDLLGRLLARKRVREALIFSLVIVAALPQVMVYYGVPSPIQKMALSSNGVYWPWTATIQLSLGRNTGGALAVMFCWTVLAFAFSRRQFERNLRFDSDAAKASDSRDGRRAWLTEALFKLPSRLFPDPLAALVDKEVRLLARSARFRLVFLMGFSFSLLLWLPMAFRPNGGEAFLGKHYLTAVCVYSLMLMGEACIWNVFGFDRSAVQVYYAMPVPMVKVLMAKNITAVLFVTIEIVIIALVCFILRIPVTAGQVVESFAVTAVLTLYVLSLGNLFSLRNPRPVDPDQSWHRSAGSKVQAMLLVLYPVLSIPILLAYLARFAFDSDWAFYGVLAVDLVLGVILYSVALETALETAAREKEPIINVLSQEARPVGG